MGEIEGAIIMKDRERSADDVIIPHDASGIRTMSVIKLFSRFDPIADVGLSGGIAIGRSPIVRVIVPTEEAFDAVFHAGIEITGVFVAGPEFNLEPFLRILLFDVLRRQGIRAGLQNLADLAYLILEVSVIPLEERDVEVGHSRDDAAVLLRGISRCLFEPVDLIIMDVVDKIASVHKGANDRPLSPVVIEKAVAVDEPGKVAEKIL